MSTSKPSAPASQSAHTSIAPAPASALAGAFATATAAIRDNISTNSERSWRADWKSFTAWCEREGLAPQPAAPETVAAYLWAEHGAGRKPATIRHRAATIAKAHRTAALADPCKTELVKELLRTIDKVRGTDQKQAVGITEKVADKIVGRVGGKDAANKDVRDLTLLLLGRDIMARANELVALTVDAIKLDADGTAVATFRRKKTSTETRACAVGHEAAAAVDRWLKLSGLAPGEPLFASLTKHGTIRRDAAGQVKPISTRDVSRVLASLGKRIRRDPGARDFSGHSLRVGLAQDLMAENIETAAILQHAGWTSDRMLVKYTRELDARRGPVAQYFNSRRHK